MTFNKLIRWFTAIAITTSPTASFAGEYCDEKFEQKYDKQYSYSITTKASENLNEAIGILSGLETESSVARWTFDAVGVTSLKLAVDSVELGRQSAQYVQKVVEYAYEAGHCTLDTAKQFQVLDGVNCVIQWPGHTLIVSVKSATLGGAQVLVTLGGALSGVLEHTGVMFDTWADNISQTGSTGEFAAVPFVIVGATFKFGRALVQFAFIDLGAGVLMATGEGVGRTLCQPMEAFHHLLAEKKPGKALKSLMETVPVAAKGIWGIVRSIGNALSSLNQYNDGSSEESPWAKTDPWQDYR